MGRVPRFVRQRLAGRGWSFEAVVLDYEASPKAVGNVAPGPLLCLATPNYNIATRHCLDWPSSPVRFTDNYGLIRSDGEPIVPAGGELDAAGGELVLRSPPPGRYLLEIDTDEVNVDFRASERFEIVADQELVLRLHRQPEGELVLEPWQPTSARASPHPELRRVFPATNPISVPPP